GLLTFCASVFGYASAIGTGVPRNRMRELRTSGSVGGLVGQPLGLPGAFFGLLWSWRRPHAVPRSKKHTCGYF
ncbi:MAG TPA: hypothetical protein VJ124_11930, partial [Pyrinomonadaceae bacterium]|nr:hypothetical protein [Pyrinomonadaceae bacterium]